MEIVTSDTLIEKVTTGKVAPFVPPTAAGTVQDQPSGGETPSTADKGATLSPQQSTDGKPRNADGTFAKEAKAGETPAGDEDDETENLTESVRRKIGKQVRRRKEAEEAFRLRDADAERDRQRADRAEAELRQLRGTKSEAGTPPGDGEPKPEDFKTVGEYTRALVKWEAKQAGIAARAAQASESEQARLSSNVNTFVDRKDAFRKVTPDFDAVIEAVEDDNVPPEAGNYIVESELGPQILYHLAKDEADRNRLAKLSGARLYAALGKIEAKLEAAATASTQTPPPPQREPNVSKAPAPVKPINEPVQAVAKDPSQMTVSELYDLRQAERAARASAGR